ncbi:MAG: hydrogenase formation protein HypD [Deltaproteobacteria bacterium]|nr:hydrogenase formation protein HypD [Deltaproteobacteria bacterium]
MNTSHEGRAARAIAREIHATCERSSRPIHLMEVCGTHTMAIAQSGLKALLPNNLKLVSGPGCPVCVTEKRYIDQALETGRKYDARIVTFGDLIRVPGSSGSLATFRSEGGRVKVVYSPLDMIRIAQAESARPTVFLGVGFETTAPTVAATLKTAVPTGVSNLYVLPAFKTIHPPLKILAAKEDLDGFLLPGHVSAIIGSDCYRYLAEEFHKPGVVAGFEPLDILVALRELVRLAVDGPPQILNRYKRVVREGGNPAAREIMYEVFEPTDAVWRGLGLIPGSGLKLRGPYAGFDSLTAMPVNVSPTEDDPRCLCAAILTGAKTPDRCGLFGKQCTPEEPVGPCMVSSEGTCAAHYKYGSA